MLTVGSCFSGIGGIELGLEWTGGFTTRWQIELDDYASAVLSQQWPSVKRYGDIKKIKTKDLEPVDVICGGYPCQPFSLAGTRSGESDPRHLWPYMLRIIHDLRPRYALLENVPGHLSMGFGRVLGDLAECGYDAEWQVLSAAGAGAPHLRKRIFVVAHSVRDRRIEGVSEPEIRGRPADTERRREPISNAAAVFRKGVVGNEQDGVLPRILADATSLPKREPPDQADAFTIERHSRQEHGSGSWWATEPDVGRVAHGVSDRVDRLTCLGNAVVPQVAEKVGRMILQHEAAVRG